MSRTYVHAPYWVQRNRAAAKDPYNYIDHDHTQRGVYDHSYTEEVEEYWDTRVARHVEYLDMQGNTRSYDITYRKKSQRVVTTYHKRLIGLTSGECDYAPMTGDYPNHRTYTECEPSWHIGNTHRGRYSYYWHAGWGKSYRDEKDQYWGGARSEERQRTRQWTKEWNSGESLSDMDDHFTYEEDHSFPFWW